MSLEAQIQANTAAIVELTKVIEQLISRMDKDDIFSAAAIELAAKKANVLSQEILVSTPEPTTEPTPEPAKAPEPTPEPLAQQMSKDDLQSWAILQVRDDKLSKKHLLAVLAEHEAKTISGLKDEQVMSVYAKLGGK